MGHKRPLDAFLFAIDGIEQRVHTSEEQNDDHACDNGLEGDVSGVRWGFYLDVPYDIASKAVPARFTFSWKYTVYGTRGASVALDQGLRSTGMGKIQPGEGVSGGELKIKGKSKQEVAKGAADCKISDWIQIRRGSASHQQTALCRK